MVIGEPPDETSNHVSNPEDGLNQHGFVVIITYPIIITGDGVED